MSDEQFFKERTESNVFIQVLQRYVPFWPLFIVTCGLSLSIAYLYLRSQVPIYVADAKVLLKDPNKGSGDSKVLDALNIFSEKKIVENEVIVLRSTSILEQVVRSLDLYATVYNEGKVRTEELYGYNSPMVFKAVQPLTVTRSGKYYFQIDWQKQEVTIDNKIVHFDSSALIGNNLVRIIPDRNYNTGVKGKNYYVEFNSIEGAAASIINDLKASAISEQSTVIDVKLETPVPQKGRDILDSLFVVYNREAIKDKNQIAKLTEDFIEGRLAAVVAQLDSVEGKYAKFRTSESVIDLGTQAQLYLTNVKEFDKQNGQIDIQLQVLNDINNYVHDKAAKPGTVPSLLLINDPTLAGLLQKLYEAELQRDRIKSVSGERSEALALAGQEVNNIKRDILENMGNIRRTLQTEKNQVTANINQNSGLLNQVPQKQRTMIDIARSQAIKNNIYTFLLQKREETALSSASTVADLRIIEKPIAYGPVRPVSKNFYLSGLAIGLLLAAFIVLLREQFNRKVLFRGEIEEKTSVAVVGEIAQVKTKNPIVILEGKRTVVAEQFRSLRTNLNFMGMSEEKKTIMITSSISGEGKSFVAINLAISFTLTGKKVALLEMDLRKPKVSKLLNIAREPGISNYLIGKASIESIIKQTEIEHLFIVSAGPIPPNPTELIASAKFSEMMQELKSRFDIIIIDTAPVGPVSDAQVLKDHADLTVFMIRHDFTPKVFLRMIEDLNKVRKFNSMCIVFNGLKRRGFSYGSYGYGGYGYGGYGAYGAYGGYGSNGYAEDERNWKEKLKNYFKF